MKVIRLDTHGSVGTVVEEEIDELEVAIAYLQECKHKKELAEKACAQAEKDVLRLMDERGEDSAWTPLNGGWQATTVYAERVVIDEEKLHKAIPTAVWTKITDRKLNRKKLEDAVGNKLLPLEVIAECSEVKVNKGYVRLTEHRESEPEEQD